MDIKIDVAVNEDFLDIAALDRVAWGNNSNSEFIPDGEHVWRIWCEHAVMYAARSDDKIVGAIVAFYCEEGGYFLHKLMVCSQYRGRGIGKLLFKTILKALDRKKVDSFLTVDPENKVAVALYEKLGYVIKEHVPGYYRNYENRYLMVRAANG